MGHRSAGHRGAAPAGASHWVRILGGRSAGVALPRSGYNASAYAGPFRSGGIALIAQSRTVTAAALDWVEGRSLGLSLLAVTGAEADIDIADLLDYAAMDPQTRSVVVQLGHVAAGRRLMSAARACARGKPVVVLQTRAGDAARLRGGPDPVRSAAFARAGLVECDSLSGLFDTLTALDRLTAIADARVAVIGNGAAICTLGVDALLRAGITPATLPAELRRELHPLLPLARDAGQALDTGSAPAATLAEVIDRVLASEAVQAVLLLHSPEPGQPHAAMARALFGRPAAARVITVWLGLATARAVRAECAAQGVITFASPDEAARALGYLRQYRQTQELLTQTPPLWEGHEARPARASRALQQADAGKPAAAALRLLREYGVGRPGGETGGKVGGLALDVRLFRHADFGTCLGLRAVAAGLNAGEVYALPPLDGVLARRALEQAGFVWDGASGGEVQRLGIALIRLASLAVEQPRVGTLDVRLIAAPGGARCLLAEPTLTLDEPPPERQRLALTPYPSDLSHRVQLPDGACYGIRAIRPEDEPALLNMLEHTDPQAIRLRFFRTIRHFSHAMAARLTQIDYDRELVLVAAPCGDAEPAGAPVVALAHLSMDSDGRRAEYAILVHQEHGGHGLGRYLMERLLDYAAQRGVATVYGEVLAENRTMLGLCRRLGFNLRVDRDDPQCLHVEIAPRRIPRPE